MDWNEYTHLRDSVHDFKATSVLVESQIEKYRIDERKQGEVAGFGKRTHYAAWVSLKTVSHFNLGTSMELMLKLILRLNNIRVPKSHLLTKLYDAVPKQYRMQLEHLYASAVQENSAIELVAFIHSSELPRHLPQNRSIRTLREFMIYLDKDVMLWQKRFGWEHVSKHTWRHYLRDLTVLTDLIDRIMVDMPKGPRSTNVSD